MTDTENTRPSLFVPLVLTQLECAAVIAALDVVAISAPGGVPGKHPLTTAAAKVQAAWDAKREEAARA